jgi:hypothetical protein
MVAAGQLVVVVHLVATASAVVVVVMVTAPAPSTVSSPPGRQRIEYGGLGGRGGQSSTATHRRGGQPAFPGWRRRQAGRGPIVRRVVLVIIVSAARRPAATASRGQVQVTARLLTGRQLPEKQ